MRYIREDSLEPMRAILRSYEEQLKNAKNDPPTEPYKSKYQALASLGNSSDVDPDPVGSGTFSWSRIQNYLLRSQNWPFLVKPKFKGSSGSTPKM